MSRKIALPLLVAAALVSIILASRTPQPIIEELPPEEADAPTALLTQTRGGRRLDCHAEGLRAG